MKPSPDLTTTPPGRTIEVYAGKGALQHRVLIRASYGGRVSYIPVPDLPRALQLKAAAYASEWRRSKASAFTSRHLTDLVHLVTLIDDVTDVLAHLGPTPPAGHLSLADILDNTAHHAWTVADTATVDAQLNWEVLRQR